MDLFSAFTMISQWTGWAPIAVIAVVGSIATVWVKNQRIEIIKDRNDDLNRQLEKFENNSPSAVVERLSERNKILNKEFDLLHNDYKNNEQKIMALEKERENIKLEFKKMADIICSAAGDCVFQCSFCFKPDEEVQKIEIPIKKLGGDVIVSIDTKCPKCGHKTMTMKDKELTKHSTL